MGWLRHIIQEWEPRPFEPVVRRKPWVTACKNRRSQMRWAGDTLHLNNTGTVEMIHCKDHKEKTQHYNQIISFPLPKDWGISCHAKRFKDSPDIQHESSCRTLVTNFLPRWDSSHRTSHPSSVSLISFLAMIPLPETQRSD